MSEQDVLDKIDDVLDSVADNKEKLAEIKAALAEEKSVQQICWNCAGTGEKGSPPAPCPDCNGDGVYSFARITKREEE